MGIKVEKPKKTIKHLRQFCDKEGMEVVLPPE